MKKKLTQKPRIAILTDTAPLNALIEDALDSSVYEVFQYASSQEKLLDAMAKNRPDCLFLKTTLTHGNGLEICSAIRKHPVLKDIAIFFLSTERDVAEQAIQYRANRFLHIPFSENDIRRTVAQYTSIQKVVLYTEDSELLHKSVVPDLEKAGFYVLERYNGREGYEAACEYDVDIIVSDVEMPEMSGLEFCEAVKSNPDTQKIPFLVTTTLDSEEAVRQGFHAGANDYMTKPFLVTELIDRIHLHLGERSSARQEKILIADNDGATRNIVAQALHLNGFYPDEVRNGRTALSRLRNSSYNLLITEHELPGLNGHELLYALRQDEKLKEIPVILLTSKEKKAEHIKYRSLGVNSYITKPFNNSKLLAETERILSREREQRNRQMLRHYLTDEAISKIYSNTEAEKQSTARDAFRTVLFTDIEKFTPLCENLTSHQVVDFLNTYFDKMVEILHRYDGMIDKYIGDAIMALFGKQADGAHRAVCAAYEMIAALPEIRRVTGIDIHMRIGINSGHVILGDIGSRHYRRDYTVIGDNVNTAQRLESNAGRDSILISETTYSLVQDLVSASEKKLTLKGKAKEATAYLVKDVVPYNR